MRVNEIWRRTGNTDKKSVIASIKILVKGGLLNTKTTREHKQAKLKIPTALGIELLELLENIEGYKNACIKCQGKLKQLLDMLQIGDEKTKMSKLKYSGWTDDGKTPSNVIQDAREALHQTSPHEIIDIILIRYISLLTKLSIDGNDTARNILHQIVMNEISNQISLMGDKADKLSDMFGDRKSEKCNKLHNFWRNSGFLDHKFISPEFRDMELLTLRILRPSEEYLDQWVQ